ncbi:DNA/RNA non-specific endonuclease [Tritonibacter mobilis]|uniref:DNA/RNA non-specific endonuclease n=1 Tax=Tritonibacter mobilis TaxID=379347 RepID=UPI000AEB3F45|nr:DNA/RNA non-specific endonuclease [Tritonibacter mobilis]
MRLLLDPYSPLRPRCTWQVADLGARAAAIAQGAQHVDLTLPQHLLNANRAYADEIHENLMAYAAQLHVLGVLAGVIDGPTEEYRAAVAEAAGSYFSNLMERSQREHWWENSSPLDGAATVLGWYYEGLGVVTQQIPVESAQQVGRDWETIGEGLQSTDPDKLIFNLGSDALSSLWDACEARWDEFWEDFDSEGLLSAMARLKADADFLAAELAIDIALAVATGGVATGVKIVAKRLAGKVSRVVIRTATKAGRSVPDSAVLHSIDLPDTEIDERIVRQVLDEDNLRTGSARDDLTERAEVENPSTEKPTSSQAAPEDVGPDPKVTALDKGQTRHQRGTNEQIISHDPATGRPTGSSGTIRQDFGSTKRGDNATAIGKLGNDGDQGGHLAAHRFFGDTPDEGIAPQAGNLNMGAWKTMENEWADWTKMGYEVDFKVDPYPPGAVRPDEFDVRYVVRDPKTGKIMYEVEREFDNEAGQSFKRVTWRDMNENYARK